MRFRKILAGILAASMMISQTPANAQISSEKQIYNTLQDSSEWDTVPEEVTASEYVSDQSASTETQTAENVTADDQTTENATEGDQTTENVTEYSQTTENVTTEEVSSTESQSTEESTENVTTGVPYTTEDQTIEDDTTEKIKEEEWQDPDNGDSIAELAADDEICTETDLTIDELKEASPDKISVNGDTVTVKDAAYMILLSHCKPEEIYNKDIIINVTGTPNFTGTVKFKHGGEEKTYAYNSIGTGDHPFEGKVTISSNIAEFDNAMFEVLSSNAEIDCTSLIRKTTSTNGQRPIIADEYRFVDEEQHEMPFTSIIVESISDETSEYSTGGMFGKITGEKGTLVVQSGIAHISSEGDATGSVPVSISGDSHVGLICGSLESGTIQLGASTSVSITFPDTYTITATGDSADAGTMIGHMNDGTAFINYAALTLTGITATSARGNAGGLIGYMAKDADLQVCNRIVINNPTVNGYENAGGLAGYAEDVILDNTGELSPQLTVNEPSVTLTRTSDAADKGAGGVFGYYKNTVEGENSLPNWIQITSDEKAEIKLLSNGSGYNEDTGSLGGLFGLLELGSATTYTVQLGDIYCHRVGEETDRTTYAGSYGAVAGCVITEDSTNSLGALKIIGKTGLSTVVADGGQRKSNGEIMSNAYYFGGLVGRIGYKENNNSHAAYLYAENVSIKAKSPFGKYEERGFGGVAGCIGEDSVLSMAGKIKVETAEGSNVKDDQIWEGGGLVGNAKPGSAMELKGTTDLTGVAYGGASYNYKAAQLVGIQDSALVYAHGDGNGNGWTLNRAKRTNNLTINDIGDYGEVLKLNTKGFSKGLDSGIVSIDTLTHKVSVKQTKGIYSGDITVKTKEDFALLATTWQSRGCFSADPDIDRNNFKAQNFNNKKLVFSGKIDLTDTGVQGLTRGYGDEEAVDNFIGIISGQDNAEIILAIGQPYGKRNDEPVTKDDKSSGQLYSWGNKKNGGRIYIGLFDKQSGSVSNLKIGGDIYAGALLAKGPCYIGAIAGNITGDVTLDNVISSVSIYADVVTDNTDHSKLLKAGGMYGSMPENSNLTLAGNTTSAVKITVSSGTTDGHARIGGVIGNIDSTVSNMTIDCNSVTLSAKLTKSDGSNAYIGGLIGVIEPANSAKRTININGLTVSDSIINTGKSTSGTCGGMLGYLWSNTDVNFEGTSNKPGLNVTSGTINAPDSEVGGLVYHANGKWTVKDYGISMTGMSITGEISVGLLVNKADVRKETSISGDIPYVLYLEVQSNWASAYKLSNITINGAPDVYDELVAYTTSAPEKIADNGVNAVISLATVADGTGRKGVNKESGVCTTYQNQTDYGKGKTNGCSRYYYDIDEIIKDVTADSGNSSNGYIGTPEELMLWSVYYYAHSSIQSNFVFADCDKNGGVTIGSSSEPNASFDMKGYSYYPVIHSGDITVSYADITFYNKEIETAENTVSNKLTSGNDTDHSQHYMMHCGLFVKNDAGTAKVEEVSFAGSIGMVNGGSGALYTHSIAGTNSSKGVSVARLTIKGMKLAGIVVNGDNSKYAPVIINSVGSYAALDIQNVDYDNTKYSSVVAGSSFIGDVGSDSATQISLSFSGIMLPDKAVTSGGIFTRASLLNSFAYKADGTSVGTYNFYYEEDWNDSSHIHKVTYGSEISDSKEFDEELQKYYYNETPRTEVYGDDNNKDFSKYLPYVYTSYSGETGYTHEIKVNQRVFDLVEGCGTYGHPYVITNQGYMDIVAGYIANATPSKDWRVTIPKTQTTICSDKERQDITYQYDGSIWKEVESNESGDSKTWEYKTNGKVISNDIMHRHILSAYYDIQGSGDSGKELVLENFAGLGSLLYPFRGVVVSTLENGATVRLKGSKTAGLINYSYGSVVRNLNIYYEYADSETTGDKDTNTGKNLKYETHVAPYSPQSFFGGVIGCIMGGDNIIDGVTVSMDNGWLSLSGDKKHLLQVGGYVGSICGGGVIFRNMKDGTGLTDTWIQSGTGIVDSKANLYVNPFVGRVLDGFAFSEDCSVDNKNKNYQVNMLNGDVGNCVHTETAPSSDNTTHSSNKVTINNAQGLLVLSAVVNSGATAGGALNNQYGTYAYFGKLDGLSNTTYKFGNGLYGKVRNATYKYVGDPKSATYDYEISKNDDRKAPGCDNESRKSTEDLDGKTNAPYLVMKYCNPATYYVSGQNRRTYVQFVEGNYDMAQYGLGYQGLGARYISSALNAGEQVKADRVIPYISGVDGNNAELIVNMKIAEYADDDFHAVSAGGLFNVLNPSAIHKPSGVADNYIQNITISGAASDNAQGEISMIYYDANGKARTKELSSSTWKNWERVSVGGLAGITAFTDERTETEKIVNVKIQNLTLGGQVAAGGIIGTVNRAPYIINDIGALIKLGNGVRSYEFSSCSYDNLVIKVNGDAGGFIGFAGNSTDYYFSITGGECKNSSIMSVEHNAGGLAASSGSRFYVNASSDGKALKTPKLVVLTDVNVKGYTNKNTRAGGVVGKLAKESGSNSKVLYYINSVNIISTKSVSIEANTYAGGIAGLIDYNNNLKAGCTIEKCTVKGLSIKTTADTSYNGGIVGYIGIDAQVTGCNISNVTTSGSTKTSSGGVAGQTRDNVILNIADTQINGINIGKSKLGGGAVGFCGNASSLYVNNFTLSDEDSSHSSINSYDSEGGVVGCSAGGTVIDIDGCTIENAKIQNGWYAGGIQGSTYGLSGINLKIKNCAVRGTTIASNKTVSNTSDTVSSGCIIGYQNGGSVQGSNILLYDNKLTSTDNKRGIFSGKTGTGNTYEGLYIAGASVQAGTPDKISSLPEQYVGGKENTADDCYVAFADYSGASLKADENTKKNLLGVTDASQPYVVTSPDSSLTVVKGGKEQQLFGDGACWTEDGSTVKPYAKTISDDSESESVKTYRIYGEYADKYKGNAFDFTNNMSTYADNQTGYTGANFPVLLISGGQTDVITQYLDILTNSGFSKVNDKYPDRIKATTEIYNYKNGKFECETDTRTMPALRVSNSSTGPITFTTSSAYDNDKDRFTLLTVTFTEDEQDYVVHVPVIVRRMLEVDFTATLNYGTHYNSAEYQELENHVLDSFGNPMTGYLTYRYNSAKGKNVEYGWQNFVDAGADVAQSMDKVLIFNQTNVLPEGTQLTIVDCQDPNRTAYYYTVTSADSIRKQFKLSNFKDSNGTYYKPESIGECMNVNATQNNTSGKFVETTADASDATVKIGDKYYRLATDDEKKDGTKDKFDMTVDDKVKTENYYFVVTMPELGANGKTTPPANGSIRTNLAVTGLPNHINYVLRKADAQGNIIDKQVNTASTYQISSGYSQSLEETLDNPPESKLLNESDTGVSVSIKDKILFPNSQAYNANDQLYQRFVVSLMTTTKDATGNPKDSYKQFPSGTKGSVSFYVYIETDSGKKYYTYNPETGIWGNPVDTKAAAVTYDWISQGGNMELPLSIDGRSENAISLQSVRDSIQSGSSGDSALCVEAVLNASIPAAGLMVIPISSVAESSVPDEYAKLNYVAQISTEKNSLSYSSSRATLKYTQTKVKYYRKVQQGAVFRYDADSINQLGINMLDLDGNLDKDKKNAIISTTASYDLTNVQNLDEILKKSSGIRYTVKLVGKSNASDSTESYNETTNIQNASDYMTVNLMSGDSGTVKYYTETDTNGTKGTWSWTIPKTTYIDTESDKSSIKKSAVFDGNTFTQAVNLYVNVDEESLNKLEGQMYSNYKVVMQVEILDASGAVVEKMTASDYVIYTFTRIKPEFVSN